MNSNDFFFLRICFNTGISLWICIVHNCLRNKSTRNYFMQILIYRVKQKLTVILLMELWYDIPAVPPMLSVIHFFSISGKHAMLLSCFVFFCRSWGRNITIWWRTWKERSEYTAGLVHSAPRKLTGFKSPIYYQMFIFHQPKSYMVSGYFYIIYLIICSGVFFCVVG